MQAYQPPFQPYQHDQIAQLSGDRNQCRFGDAENCMYYNHAKTGHHNYVSEHGTGDPNSDVYGCTNKAYDQINMNQPYGDYALGNLSGANESAYMYNEDDVMNTTLSPCGAPVGQYELPQMADRLPLMHSEPVVYGCGGGSTMNGRQDVVPMKMVPATTSDRLTLGNLSLSNLGLNLPEMNNSTLMWITLAGAVGGGAWYVWNNAAKFNLTSKNATLIVGAVAILLVWIFMQIQKKTMI